ncbi:MAG: hypothetical protein H8E14_15535 [Candidatus Marinimicrobia bacterium]|nr:hypothetical protein [Candidatus Neomarinimicrobiota bacterium]
MQIKLCPALGLLVFGILLTADVSACTAGLAGGKATGSGRCLLWKNRDSSHRNNEIIFLSHGAFRLIGVINADDTTQIWAGVNNFGFAIMNAEARDMAKPDEETLYDEEGYLMKAALLSCRSVEDFETMLKESNQVGRGVTSNFGVIDTSGAAEFFETGNHEYFRFDATNQEICPTSFIGRANFADHGYNEEAYGHGRFQNAVDLSNVKAEINKLDVSYLISTVTRDIATIDPDAADTALFKTAGTVNRHRTVSCSVFESTLLGEDPCLTTYWITLGEPAVSVAVPLWVYAGEVPAAMDGDGGAPLNLLFQELKAYVYPDTSRPKYINAARLAEVQKQTDKIQKRVLKKTAKQLRKWRKIAPTSVEVADFQRKIIAEVMKKLERIKL